MKHAVSHFPRQCKKVHDWIKLAGFTLSAVCHANSSIKTCCRPFSWTVQGSWLTQIGGFFTLSAVCHANSSINTCSEPFSWTVHGSWLNQIGGLYSLCGMPCKQLRETCSEPFSWTVQEGSWLNQIGGFFTLCGMPCKQLHETCSEPFSWTVQGSWLNLIGGLYSPRYAMQTALLIGCPDDLGKAPLFLVTPPPPHTDLTNLQISKGVG
jgi:hypothetical protein